MAVLKLFQGAKNEKDIYIVYGHMAMQLGYKC